MPTILITGAARRLGAAMARRFARGGFHVVIHYGRSGAEAEALAAALAQEGHAASTLSFDLSNPEQIRPALDAFITRHPDWSVAVNNASAFDYDSAHAPARDIWHATETVNLWAAIEIARALSVARAAENAAIVNILDQKLVNLNPDFFSYTLTKAALDAAGRMLAIDAAPHIRVCNVAPGLTLPSADQTGREFAKVATRNLLQRQTLPDDIAEGVFFVATSAFSSGQTLYVDGGQRFCPEARDVMFASREGPNV